MYHTLLGPYCCISKLVFKCFQSLITHPHLHWLLPSLEFSHLSLHSHLRPYNHQKLHHFWNHKLRLPSLWLWPPILQFSHSITWSTPVLCSSPFPFSQLASSWVTLIVVPFSLPPSFFPQTLTEHFLRVKHYTKCKHCKVETGVDSSHCSFFQISCPFAFL